MTREEYYDYCFAFLIGDYGLNSEDEVWSIVNNWAYDSSTECSLTYVLNEVCIARDSPFWLGPNEARLLGEKYMEYETKSYLTRYGSLPDNDEQVTGFRYDRYDNLHLFLYELFRDLDGFDLYGYDRDGFDRQGLNEDGLDRWDVDLNNPLNDFVLSEEEEPAVLSLGSFWV